LGGAAGVTVLRLTQALIAKPVNDSTKGFAKANPETAESLEQTVPSPQQWCGRRVRVHDGTTVLMSVQKLTKGIILNIATKTRLRISACQTGGGLFLIYWSSCGAFIAPFQTSEVELSRQLYEDLDPLDVALADKPMAPMWT
jgi:hypothetical protein